MSFTESIFDEEDSEGFTLWNRDFEGQGSPFHSQQIIIDGRLTKKSNSKHFERKYFALTDQYLYYKTDAYDLSVRGWMHLDWVRVEYIKKLISSPKSNSTEMTLYGFRFLRNMKFTEIFTEDQQVFCDWAGHLKRMLIQTNFDDIYSVDKTIGRGSFSEVYQATENATGRRYAVKYLTKVNLNSQYKGRLAIKNEIQIMKSCKGNPCVVALLEVHELPDTVYIVMELLEGDSLHTYVLKGGYGDQEIVFIMRNILETLIFLKNNKIIHRDIKPDNIVFKSRNFKLNAKKLEPNLPKFIDFGLSTYTDKGFYIYRRVGSLGFTAPEIINLRPGPVTYDYMTDIYTAGLIFCFLKTGNSPFYHGDEDTILQRNKDNQINWNLYDGKMEPGALEFFKRMVVTNPVDRPTAEL